MKQLALGCLAIGAVSAGVALNPPQKKVIPTPKVDFNRDIRPILSDHCYKCHGPDGKEVKAALRLSDRADAVKDRDGYFIIKPGKAHLSELIKRVEDTKNPMPPKDSGVPRLTKEQVRLLKIWINSGAKYERHWAFVAPKMPLIPTTTEKTANEIDSFVFAKLKEKGFRPEKEADRNTLLRRASLTLTGLLPTLEEADRFLLDTKPMAFERAVDRLLASERYGEHQARFWLDAVRYGDTHGLHLDNERAIYPYRDWVVRALNRDLPFDQFTIDQLAGDLLPKPTNDQLVATGYVRMNPTTAEGGAIEEEFQVKNTFDRVDTLGTVFLGLTVGCAKCHDHKYDPISAKEYYSLGAYLNSTKDAPLDGNALSPEPSLRAPSPEESEKSETLKAQLNSIESSTSPIQAEQWVKSNQVSSVLIGQWEVCETFRFKTFDEAFDEERTPQKWAKATIELGKPVIVVSAENASSYARTTINSDGDRDLILRIGSDDAVKVWLNGKLVHSNKVFRSTDATDIFTVPVQKGKNDLLIKIVNAGGADGLKFNFGTDEEQKLQAIMSGNDPQKVVKAYLLVGPDSARAMVYRKKSKELDELESRIPKTLIAQEMEKPRDAFVLHRGEYDQRREKVTRGIPSILGKLPKSAPNNRLGLARWLVDPSNPLTSRVFVNRIWQQHFGTGLVKTAEDFGNQGEWPSHPELLDYLALRFIKDGYSMKKLHRLIVTSQAFRQSAVVTTAKLKADPENRLISRGPRYRLDGEILRDKVLQVSGLLVQRQGGRGFKPYQPAGLWEEVAFQGSNTSTYTQDMSADIYRRTLYLFWKRTSPHPVMSTFDAPTREACVVRRPRTNTPLQALITMNEPAFLEASRVFAQKIVSQPGDRLEFAFQTALGRKPGTKEKQILGASLQRYLDRFSKDESAATDLVTVGLAPRPKGQSPSEVAAWMMIASTLFNLDEFLTQH